MSELQEFIYRRIRISALPYLPLSIVLLLISAGILYFLFSFDKPVTIPRIFLVFPIMFPIIAIWLIYQWFLTLNLKKHPLVNLLFENPSDIQKIIILKNELGVHRVTFKHEEGSSPFITIWNKNHITMLLDLIQQDISRDIVVEWEK